MFQRLHHEKDSGGYRDHKEAEADQCEIKPTHLPSL
jgi:hypothetical protein